MKFHSMLNKLPLWFNRVFHSRFQSFPANVAGGFLLAVLMLPCLATAGPFAYVTNGNDNTLSIIDTANNTLVATVNTGTSPNDVAVSPDGSRAYVANGEGTVSVVDTGSNTVVATVNVGGFPYGVAVSPDGTRIYVTNNTDDTVSVIDTPDPTVVATVSTGTSPTGVAVSPDGSRIYVINNNNNTISVIDTANNTVAATVSTGTSPTGVAVSPDGSRIYVTNNNSNTISVIDTANNTVVATVNVDEGPIDVAVHPDGTRIYIAHAAAIATVSVINTSNYAQVATVDAGGNTERVRIAFRPATYDPSQTAAVPTLSEWGLLNLSGLLVVVALGRLTPVPRRQSNPGARWSVGEDPSDSQNTLASAAIYPGGVRGTRTRRPRGSCGRSAR